MKKPLITASMMVFALLLSSCTLSSGVTLSWRYITLTDVLTGETFKISRFAGTPLVVGMMTMNSEICEEQMKEMMKAQEKAGDHAVFISLNLDSSLSDEALRGYMERNGFSWYVATLSEEQADNLEAEFGSHIVNIAASPVIVLDPWQDAHMLRPGVKSADYLLAQIERHRGF